MWLWISIGIIVFLIVLEESVNWGWKRYLFGPNLKRKEKWKCRIKSVRGLWKKIRTKSESSN